MVIILAFDIFGTVLDTSTVIQEFRNKQLEYTWLLTIMGKYVEFEEITKITLRYILKVRGEESKFDEELNKWKNLKAYEDTKYLKEISEIAEVYALSNGSINEVKQHLERNGLLRYFKGIFSAESVKEYKPSPKVYKYFLDSIGAKEAFLVSSNAFDVIGAKNAGMRSIFVNRKNTIVDPIGGKPDVIVNDFKELYEWILRYK
ncbi:TPA: haloacid dehalogenase type II [Sulfurisphaera tokodaii]|uniref:Haloacid dehalogenase type II n=1 Tax=Sulfurisphaera tokodaii TaxID=111955 RepID=A0A832TH07_9CREN|nr:haloacid dehalogenase type II [Sulfurisphaera tokodaii]